MTYRTELTRDAAKSLRAIQKKDQVRIAAKIDSLAESLSNPSETKLKGNNPFQRVRDGCPVRLKRFVGSFDFWFDRLLREASAQVPQSP